MSPEVLIKNSCAFAKFESPLFISALLTEKLCCFRFAFISLEFISMSNPDTFTLPLSSSKPFDWLKNALSV